ncbi:MAG TPA: bifunctional 5,10-methylenetetrahydrofolate dehydrogenase/5,10-methenyltetrahydrofolate cyclohydrolase [Lachnospiraceae bacterium]
MENYLLGKEVVEKLNEEIREGIECLKKEGIIPKLVMIRVGENPDDISYERGATKRCENLKVAHETLVFPNTVKEETLIEVIKKLNEEKTVHGVLLFRPLPGHLNEDRILSFLAPSKDVDGVTQASLSGVFMEKELGFAPCTPKACIRMLDHYGISCQGKNVVVVGRSMVVGKPLSMLLLKKNATVTVCHSKSENLSEITKKADIVIVAMGKAQAMGEEFFSKGQTVLDVGIHVTKEGKLCGDVKTKEVAHIVDKISPVPGGVGAVTSAMLLYHVLESAIKSVGEDYK